MVSKRVSLKKHHLASLFIAIAVVAAVLPFVSQSPSVRAASGTKLYLSPASQTVTTGGNMVVSIVVNTGGASVNTVQSVLSYSTANFSLVSIAPGAAFSDFPNSASSGSIQFSAGTSTPVNGVQTVATLTLHATGTGTSAISLNSNLCGPGNYTLTCTAAYDSVTSNNDLIGATTPITNGSYTVAAAPVTPAPVAASSSPSSSSPATQTGSTGTTKTGSTSSGSTKAASGSTPASSSTSAPTPTTTTTNPAPVITNVKVSGITATSATVTWQTNLPSSSVVEYGLTPSYGLTAQASGLVTAHQVTLAAPYITQGTTFYLQVLSATASGASTTGGAQQFTAMGFVVTVHVVDQHNKPIRGAKVTVDGQSQTTNNTGVSTFHNLPAGLQKVVIKSGRSLTNRIITIGKLDPKTGAYQPQVFILTAVRGSSLMPYVLVAVIALLAAGALFVPIGPLNRLMHRFGKGPGGMDGGTGSGSNPAIISGSPTVPTATTPTSGTPTQIITPGSSPASVRAAVSTMPITTNGVKLGKPNNPEPGTVIEPGEAKK